MIIYHATKTREAAESIIREKCLRPGRNVTTGEQLVHVSLTPFEPGTYALDVIGKDTNQAWVFTLEISDDIVLEDDPSKEGKFYGGIWKISKEIIPIKKILTIEHIPNVLTWEE